MKIKHLPVILEVMPTDSRVTKRVKMDFNTLTDLKFLTKYYVSKKVYLKRVLKYGDPYKHITSTKFYKLLYEK